MSDASQPIALDFVSDPSGGAAGAKRIEFELARVEARVKSLESAFGKLDAAVPSSLSAKIANIATSTGRMQVSAQGSASAAINLANALNALNNSKGVDSAAARLSDLTAKLQAAMTSLRQAQQGRTTTSSGGGAAGSTSSDTSGDAGTNNMALGLARVAGRVATVGALAYEVKRASSAAMDFEQAMAGVAAVGEIDKASEAFARLADAAKSGSKQFNATEKAEGLRELVAAGMTATQATQSLSGVLQLATAGEISMGRAAEIAVASLSSFKIEAKDFTKVVDTMTAAANASPASIDDMGEAMKFVGPVAQALKISIQDTSAALAILANNGVRGGIAGRGLGAVLARIIAPSKEASEAVEALGLKVDDLNPSIVGMQKALANLRGLDQKTLVDMFGAENLDISNILASNASAFADMAEKMNQAEGAGRRFAETIANTTSGKLKGLKNTITEIESEVGKLINTLGVRIAQGLKDTAFDPSNILSGLQASAPNRPGGEAEAYAKEFSNARTEEQVERARAALRRRKKELIDEANSPSNFFFGDTEAIEAELAKLDKVLYNSNEIVANGAKRRKAEMEKLAASIPFEGPLKENAGPRLIGPSSTDAGSDTSSDKALEKLEKKRAATNQALEDASKKQTAIDKRKEAEEKAAEKKKLDDAKALRGNVVADSLQAIGGGGRFFGGDGNLRIQERQLATQEQIRDAITTLNQRIGDGSGVLRVSYR